MQQEQTEAGRRGSYPEQESQETPRRVHLHLFSLNASVHLHLEEKTDRARMIGYTLAAS
jgi:hypothetical protein